MSAIKPWMWIVLGIIVIIIIVVVVAKKPQTTQVASSYSYNPYQLNQLTRQV